MMIQSCLLFGLVFILQHHVGNLLPTKCQANLSKYAYHMDSVITNEGPPTCKAYNSGLKQNVVTENYIICDGSTLRLTDSDLGSEQYTADKYYLWTTSSSNRHLLYIFPKRVNLTTITLHYYSDNTRGLPRLRFFAVPDDFEVWDALVSSYVRIDVAEMPPDSESSGQRNIIITYNMNTMKVVMSVDEPDFQFAVSEVEFSVCSSKLIQTCIINYVYDVRAGGHGKPLDPIYKVFFLCITGLGRYIPGSPLTHLTMAL